MAKLLTNHDPYHIHAMCGLLALLHYFYRFRLAVLDVPDSGFGQNLQLDILSMTVMALPNVTSFLFNIVRAKKGLDGFTIWKEYRLHAFIFAIKFWLLLAMLLYSKHSMTYNHQHGSSLKYEVYYRAAFEFATMGAAQYVTSMYPPQVSTIRGMYSKSSFMVFFAGFLQFLGRASIFCGTPDPRDNISVLWFSILVIQLNAFNMTLRKKRIIGPRVTQAFYTVMLGGAFYLFFVRRFMFNMPGPFDRSSKAVYLAGVAYYCRKQGCDRFTSWLVSLSLIAVASQQFGLFQDKQPEMIG